MARSAVSATIRPKSAPARPAPRTSRSRAAGCARSRSPHPRTDDVRRSTGERETQRSSRSGTQHPSGTCEPLRGHGIGMFAAGHRHQPIGQRQQTQGERDAGQAMQDRQAIADLPSIDLLDAAKADERVRGVGAWLKIDAAAAQFPVAEARRLRPLAAAHFSRPGPMNCRSAGLIARGGFSRLYFWGLDLRNSTSRVKVCQKMRQHAPGVDSRLPDPISCPDEYP